MDRRDASNLTSIVLITLSTAVLSLWWLVLTSGTMGHSTDICSDHVADWPAFVFNVSVAVLGSAALLATLVDKMAFTIEYKVIGRPEIEEVKRSFAHCGKWTTFTLWCNTVGTAYFWVAAVEGGLARLPSQPITSEVLSSVARVLWEITFPMAFLVNLVVSFVLIPAMKKQRMYQKLYLILKWRPQVLHNGFVLATAGEAVIAKPCMDQNHFCVVLLYGLAYLVFAYQLFLRTGVFHYFFLDYRFKFSAVSVVGLLILLTLLFFGGYYFLQEASSSLALQAMLVVIALATCTFSDKHADPYVDEITQAC